jgi:hypothetical protein
LTIRIPPKNFLDKILEKFGKKRITISPKNLDKIYKEYGPYVQIRGKKESILKALFRKKVKDLDEDSIK